ncbi:MAG: TonB-dependent receptor, partial [Algibacter sp.]
DVVSSWVSYSYSNNNYTFDNLNDGKKFPNNSDITHAITFASTYTSGKIKFAAGLNWHSGIPNTKPAIDDDSNDNIITYASPNSSRLDDYLRADCSATYAFNISESTRATIGASIWNILNKSNIINKYYTLDESNEINPVENRSLGITPNVSFRVHF